MKYKVMDTTMETITVWDGRKRDKYGPGTIDLYIGSPHPFRKGQEVSIAVRLETDVPLTDEDMKP